MPSKHYDTALTLGKFAPFHKGHVFLIEQALAQSDRVIVLIYHAPSTIDIPAKVRADWIRKCFKQTKYANRVTVLIADGGSESTGYTQDIIDEQNNYLTSFFSNYNNIKIDAFFASEPYGEFVAKALGCDFVAVDIERNTIPISATDIRACYDINSHNKTLNKKSVTDVATFLPIHVQNALKPSLYFLGAPSTGKTTLCEALSNHLPANLCLEYGRYYWHEHQINHRLTMNQLEELAIGHLRWEDVASSKNADINVIDTNLITTCSYAKYYHGYVSDKLTTMLKDNLYRYKHVFVCDTDIPFDNTWDRSGEGSRSQIQRILLELLAQYKVSYTLISGSINQRINQMYVYLKKNQTLQNILKINQL